VIDPLSRVSHEGLCGCFIANHLLATGFDSAYNSTEGILQVGIANPGNFIEFTSLPQSGQFTKRLSDSSISTAATTTSIGRRKHTSMLGDSYIAACMSRPPRSNYSYYVDYDEALIDYLEDLIATTKDPNQVGALIDVLFRLRNDHWT
jgi:hypothetical protein